VEFDAAVARLDALVTRLEREGDERALELLQLVDAIHRPALELIAAGQTDHPVARALLAMYDLGPVDEYVQAEEALDEVRPYVESHGGRLDLLGVEDGVVRVALSGSCDGCAGSEVTLRRGVESVLRERVEGFRELVAEEQQVTVLPLAGVRRPVFADVDAAGLEPGALRAVEVDGVSVLLANADGEVYAVRNGCAVDGLALEGGRLNGSVLICPWHNCAYDVRTGRRVDDSDEPGLTPVPVALRNGAVQVAVNVG
jgi:nitrite reductase/ring-hydroxylating ferredoxin subunit/Fe-S cluster biogenesis protein NfuA